MRCQLVGEGHIFPGKNRPARRSKGGWYSARDLRQGKASVQVVEAEKTRSGGQVYDLAKKGSGKEPTHPIQKTAQYDWGGRELWEGQSVCLRWWSVRGGEQFCGSGKSKRKRKRNPRTSSQTERERPKSTTS